MTENTIKCEDGFIVQNEKLDRLHERSWHSKSLRSSFCTSYYSEDSLSIVSGQRRNTIASSLVNYENFWGDVYGKLVVQSGSQLDFLVDSLRYISIEEGLNSMEFANLIVSFVQDISYSYVRSKDCADFDNKGNPCVGNIDLGILSPYEFLHTLYGDCDTRSVLIYAMLEKVGFDPMIVISDEYAHAMLALSIPAVGDHLKHRGKNYYFWETTGKDWQIGMLPPNSNNVNYWKVALVNDNL